MNRPGDGSRCPRTAAVLMARLVIHAMSGSGVTVTGTKVGRPPVGRWRRPHQSAPPVQQAFMDPEPPGHVLHDHAGAKGFFHNPHLLRRRVVPTAFRPREDLDTLIGHDVYHSFASAR